MTIILIVKQFYVSNLRNIYGNDHSCAENNCNCYSLLLYILINSPYINFINVTVIAADYYACKFYYLRRMRGSRISLNSRT